MGLSNRSIRHRIATAAFALFALFATAPRSLLAQEQLQPNQTPAGLGATDETLFSASCLQAHFWNLGCLARPCISSDYHHGVVHDRLDDFILSD